ncbi:MAG: PHP domain-containing protein [Balneolaceae bacterium]|nr:PHP domain-containing protein [Balneolaceae bacterium]
MIGNVWRKWDLHFHTQTSYDYQNKGVSDQEIIDTLVANNLEVIAITDHHVMDVQRIANLQELGKGKVTVLPGIEFRAELGGSDSIHFIGIFSEKSDIEDIWIKLQSTCGITKKDIQDKGGDQYIHCDLKETCHLIHSLGGLVTVHAGGKANTIENITNTLPYKMALKTDLVLNHIDILELGQVKDQEDYRNIVFPAIKAQIPMIICSDNHNITDYQVKQNLWIKSEPTFEGLKQILFEPEYRIHIGANAPIPPPIRINKIVLDFPADSMFENESFCLSGKNEINLSPNFTCIIGGRGAGKSTILNLIHEKLKSGENQFFSTKKIRDVNGNILSIEDSVDIDNDADEKYIEFLSQNEIEDFAQDYHKLTSAVYGRILKRDELGLISNKEEVLKQCLASYKKHIINVRRIETLKTELEQKKKELATNKKLVESFSSEEYKRINAELKDLTVEINQLKSSIENYNLLVADLSELQTKNSQVEPKNEYALEIERIVKALKEITDSTALVNFSASISKLSELEAQLIIKKAELKKYLSDKGLTEENLKDISNANILINSLEDEIQKREADINVLQLEIDGFDENISINASSDYQTEIETQIKSISEILENLKNTSVKPISLNFDFDENAANDKIFSDFKSLFEGQIARSNYKSDNVLKDILFCVSPKDITTKEVLIEALKNYPSASNAKGFLIELFGLDSNFKAYKLLTKMTYLNYVEFKMVKVQYDGRPIEKSSFGQRCTAVLVILLLLGNNPIIIDEPEAHLDSLLISNYLVEVIKDRKRSRQIVFATHNANFVVNGDAELIHILSIDEASQSTVIKSTTIENEDTRETLIGLEGGFEAFKKRENKYQYRIK